MSDKQHVFIIDGQQLTIDQGAALMIALTHGMELKNADSPIGILLREIEAIINREDP